MLGHIWKFWTFGIFKEPEGGFPKTNSNSFLATNIMKPRYKLTVKKKHASISDIGLRGGGGNGVQAKTYTMIFSKVGCVCVKSLQVHYRDTIYTYIGRQTDCWYTLLVRMDITL